MNISLNSRLENLIQQQITSGKYDDINDVIEDALTLLEKRNQYDQWVKEIGEKIDIAAQQLDRPYRPNRDTSGCSKCES